MLKDELKSTFLFEKFSDAHLDWLVAHAQVIETAAGEWLFREREETDALYVLLQGETQLTRSMHGHEIISETSSQPGNWGGWLPMFDALPMVIGLRTSQPSRVLRIPRDAVRHMIDESFLFTHHLLTGIYVGVQNTQALTNQQEKLVSLGTLAAGLAHELNNPAAAACRSAGQLKMAFGNTQVMALQLGRHLNDEQITSLFRVLNDVTENAGKLVLDPLTQSDREEAASTWLEEHAIANAWEVAPIFVSAGVDVDALARVANEFPVAAIAPAINWLAAALDGIGLADSIERSTTRISELVSAVKSYTYMDQANMQAVDVHEGLENTLIIMKHKLRDGGVSVVRDYERSLPKFTAFGGELNQLWTNLIDNAIDAMAQNTGARTLTLRTRREGNDAVISVGDNGSGIPPEVQRRIFEPFFTTKPVGKGTGIGLDVAYRTVVTQHNGDIQVTSESGNTQFVVKLPLNHRAVDDDAH